MGHALQVDEGSEKRSLQAGSEQELADARAVFYPAWWIHKGASRQAAPLYRVICSSEDEVALARTLKPDFIDAEYLLVE